MRAYGEVLALVQGGAAVLRATTYPMFKTHAMARRRLTARVSRLGDALAHLPNDVSLKNVAVEAVGRGRGVQ
mgnify:CR=1 FL=1